MDCELCVVYIGSGGTMPLVENCWCEDMNKLVEGEAVIP